MTNLNLDELTHAIKLLIIDECDKSDDISIDEFEDDLPFFGKGSPLALDSLDTLQISMAVQKTYGVRIEGAGVVRSAMNNAKTLAEFIIANQHP